VDYADVQAELFRGLREDDRQPLDVIGTVLERHQSDPAIYAKLIASFVNVVVPEDTARVLFHRVLKHHQSLVHLLGRPVDIRVSMMDFTVQHPELVRTPVIVDQETFTLSQRMAALDELTGLYNRRFLELSINKELNRARRYSQEFSLVFMDLDDFKQINDTQGHDTGDRVLASVGSAISRLLRREDLAGRYGGEEFVVLLPQTDATGAQRFAQRLQESVRSITVTVDRVVSFSGGIATYPEAGDTTAELLHNADTALYRAKLAGKKQTHLFSVEKRRGKRHSIQIRAAAEADEFDMGEVVVQDVSRTGLAAQAPRLLAPGARVRFRFVVEEQAAEEATLEIVARVVWSRKMDTDHYQFGGAWQSVDESLIQALVTHRGGG
jgi:diguanylate cyclase (GGDEF)-like protein